MKGHLLLMSVWLFYSTFACTSPPSPVCGDGKQEAPEACDDGNTVDGDGCSRTCEQEIGWNCDAHHCTPICGDNILVKGEACDDGNTKYNDGCSPRCTVEGGWTCDPNGCEPICGDGVLVIGELCDVKYDPYCSRDCKTIVASCGDGKVQSPIEECDGVRGCRSTCRAKLGFTCDAATNTCMGSQIAANTMVKDFTQSEITMFCTWLIKTLGEPGESYDCGAIAYTNNSVSTCVASITSEKIAGDEACTIRQYEDWVGVFSTRCELDNAVHLYYQRPSCK